MPFFSSNIQHSSHFHTLFPVSAPYESLVIQQSFGYNNTIPDKQNAKQINRRKSLEGNYIIVYYLHSTVFSNSDITPSICPTITSNACFAN